MAARWLQRWLSETQAPTIDDAVLVAGALAALGGEQHNAAAAALQTVAEKATSRSGAGS